MMVALRFPSAPIMLGQVLMMGWSSFVLVALLLSASSALLAAPLTRADISLEGMRVTVLPLKQTVSIEPLPVLHYEFDGQLTLGQPGWQGDFLLPKTAWVFRALRPGSLVVTLADKPDARLAEGKDYLLDADWGSVNAAPGSAFPPGVRLDFAYDYTESRIDLVELAPNGRIAVKQGTPDMSAPLLPAVTPGSTPLLSVYLAHNTQKLTPDNINLIDPSYRGVPPAFRSGRLQPVKAKLTAGAPVTIAFFGDSITAQEPGDFRDGKGSFVDRFVVYLRERYPKSGVVVTPKETVLPPKPGRIVIVKAGVGGDDTRDGLARIDTDVLAHKPDLVVVMFGANDENRTTDGSGRTNRNNVPPAEYEQNLRTIVTRIKSAGGEPLLMTTSMKNRGWEGTTGNLDQYAAAARRVATDENTCLVDNYAAWENLPRLGYDYLVFLDSCINHPNYLGHQVFFEGLRAAFEETP
jgi:lysophospholipase L1-like esterase